MTHIDNVPHILMYGITHRNSPNANPNFTPIGDSSLISTRDKFVLDNGKLLGEYVPFYFGTRMPMLYVIQKGYNGVTVTEAKDIVYCVTSVQRVIDTKLEFVYTSGHAFDLFSSQFEPQDVFDIENQVDFQAVKVKDWKDPSDLDLKRRMQAEFLLLGDLPFEDVLGFIVRNEEAKNQLLNFGVAENQIKIITNAYF
ncbi:DUF4433 domain-containing protein [Flavobacterium sp.]|uniref:type II toxin-antitoxin system toxin DNA ADP-ribosyl transferase DarT n=1 Tax=Flavobacterium sp. TaxID=239 RepID=UPI002610B771|nr:DUF4433 domain-containing protein [Flavobacterium sp.]